MGSRRGIFHPAPAGTRAAEVWKRKKPDERNIQDFDGRVVEYVGNDGCELWRLVDPPGITFRVQTDIGQRVDVLPEQGELFT